MDKKKIFLADDDNDSRDILSRILRRTYDVRSFPDGKALFDGLNNGQLPQLIITDFDMPKLNGLALTKLVRAKFPNIPVIMMSGGIPLPDNPADTFFGKPFDTKALQEKIEELINKSCL